MKPFATLVALVLLTAGCQQPVAPSATADVLRAVHTASDITAVDPGTPVVVGPVPREPATREEGIAFLVEDVEALLSAGLLNHGEANALIRTLHSAAKRIGKGEFDTASKLLEAFIHKLEAMVRSGRLPEYEAQRLISDTKLNITWSTNK